MARGGLEKHIDLYDHHELRKSFLNPHVRTLQTMFGHGLKTETCSNIGNSKLFSCHSAAYWIC